MRPDSATEGRGKPFMITVEQFRTELVMFAAFIVAIPVTILLSKRAAKGKGPLESGFIAVRVSILGFGIILCGLYISLPMTPVLSTFGYPADLHDINSPEKLLVLLQEYNHAIVDTAKTIRYFFVAFAAWFLGSMYALGTFSQIASRTTASIQESPTNHEGPP
jgi:hypothetical protein